MGTEQKLSDIDRETLIEAFTSQEYIDAVNKIGEYLKKSGNWKEGIYWLIFYLGTIEDSDPAEYEGIIRAGKVMKELLEKGILEDDTTEYYNGD